MVALLLSEVPSSFRRIITGIRGNSAAAAAEYRIARSGSMGNEHMVQQQTGNAQHFRCVYSVKRRGGEPASHLLVASEWVCKSTYRAS